MNIEFALELLDRPGVFSSHVDRHVEGVATSGHRNSNGTIIQPRGMLCTRADRVPVLWAHDYCRPLGLVTNTAEDGEGRLRFDAKLATRFAWSDEVWEALKAARVCCSSIGVTPLIRRADGNVPEWILEEISICPKGANIDARIDRVWEVRNPLAILPTAKEPREKVVHWDVRRASIKRGNVVRL